MGTGVTGRALMLVCLAVGACASDSGSERSSWDARPAASPPAAPPTGSPQATSGGADVATAVVPTEEKTSPRLAGDPSPRIAQRGGPLPLDGRAPPVVNEVAPVQPPSSTRPAGTRDSQSGRDVCPSYGNEAAAIREAQLFPVQSARMAVGYQVSDSTTRINLWRDTPLVVLGLGGRPVYCAAERVGSSYRVPAGRRICFADSDGDFLFDHVFILQSESKDYGTAPVRYELNPLEAARRPSSACHARAARF